MSLDSNFDKNKLGDTAVMNAMATQMSPKMNTRSSIDNEGTRLQDSIQLDKCEESPPELERRDKSTKRKSVQNSNWIASVEEPTLDQDR